MHAWLFNDLFVALTEAKVCMKHTQSPLNPLFYRVLSIPFTGEKQSQLDERRVSVAAALGVDL